MMTYGNAQSFGNEPLAFSSIEAKARGGGDESGKPVPSDEDEDSAVSSERKEDKEKEDNE